MIRATKGKIGLEKSFRLEFDKVYIKHDNKLITKFNKLKLTKLEFAFLVPFVMCFFKKDLADDSIAKLLSPVKQLGIFMSTQTLPMTIMYFLELLKREPKGISDALESIREDNLDFYHIAIAEMLGVLKNPYPEFAEELQVVMPLTFEFVDEWLDGVRVSQQELLKEWKDSIKEVYVNEGELIEA